ncbi:MAG TPA: M23 family metallopeptidase [Acidimicrobiales bacterium]|nr:M23 family metallopeptidase [Acidimicrobiales bacterium]
MVAGLAAGSSSTFAVLLPASHRTPTRHASRRATLAAAAAPVVSSPGAGTGGAGDVIDDTQATLSRLAIADAASRGVARSTAKVWPASGGLTGWFGEGRPGHHHSGLDIDGETGDPVVAAEGGTVTVAGPAPAGYSGYGRMVVIDHPDGTETLYAHLSVVSTTAGAVVAAGDPIGAIGTSGNVTGSHLHFEVRVGGVPVDPRPWLPPR